MDSQQQLHTDNPMTHVLILILVVAVIVGLAIMVFDDIARF